MTLDEVERRAILARLRRCGGHRADAARAPGVTAKTLYSKINRYAAEGHAVPPAPRPRSGVTGGTVA